MKSQRMQICYYGNPILRKRAQEITEITPEIVELAQKMIQHLVSSSNYVGLAAPQVGVSLRLLVMRYDEIDSEGNSTTSEPIIIINPELSNPSSRKETLEEGCLSIPGVNVPVSRPESIHVRYQNIKGEIVEEDFHGFKARVLMHENDHLNGVLIVDRIGQSLKKKIQPKLQIILKSNSQ
jgi:peptide deformylase